MTTRLVKLTRPAPGTDPTVQTGHRRVGYALAGLGFIAAAVAFVGNLLAAGQAGSAEAAGAARNLAWAFGVNTAAFGTIKLAIAVVLIGILVRLWLRVESVRDALPALKADAEPRLVTGAITTPYGAAVGTSDVPKPLLIHVMARRMWAPMLFMGYMAVLVGLVISFVWAGDPADVALSAWTQGLQFLGEGLVLAGITFLLGTILASLREGGGEVQASLGLTVKTLG